MIEVEKKTIFHKKFVAYFFHSSFALINLGICIDIASPNIEIHLPFGFIRIGWQTYLIKTDDKARLKVGREKVFGYIPKGYF